jgi:hypothetical protein
MRLDREDHDIGRTNLVERRRDRRPHLKLPVGTHHAQAVVAHRGQMRAACVQDDVGAGTREARTDVAADGTRADDDELHDALVKASATSRR